ncbi:MarR family winged helix-turn-helix transcriptional regulator [Methanobacterium paludis]|uniref:Transcriptional regulator, MarR family n=1 Tax=Methanobacterium paludis (strain DSM 25820 / JCM 18151 / SWAN1) TaxID=868131 RepID=F6D2Y4_METPW|nr:MarR family winged helix-turn-helix transcriptional regulator [Methanobacterium paludis]AEG19113.1 transcriptional regulator, MarR family [Methanobacterium paludis]
MGDGSLCNCLYFTSNRLSRVLTKMAEEEFKSTGLFPSQALALMIINDKPGISQNDLSRELDIKPSTTSRFIDKLEHKNLVKREVKGKSSFLYSTADGLSLMEKIDTCWKNLFQRYSTVLGQEEGAKLTNAIHNAVDKLEKEL